MIEEIIYKHMSGTLDVPVYMEVPEPMPDTFVVLEKTGGSRTNHVCRATFAVQSYAESLFKAAQLNEEAKAAMDDLVSLDEIGSVRLNSDYNFTDTEMKRYRHQAVYDLTHY